MFHWPIGGHLVNQLAFLLLPALAAPWLLGLPLRPTLGLRRPAGADVLLALAAGLGATALSQAVAMLQAPLLPVPEKLLQGPWSGADLPLPAALLLWAVVPALCEETLFRGAVLGMLRSGHGRAATLLAPALAFGLFHLSIFRLLPTAAFGVLLGWAALRSRSLAVPVLVHAVHNGVLFTLAWAVPEAAAPPPAVLALGTAAALASVWAMGRR